MPSGSDYSSISQSKRWYGGISSTNPFVFYPPSSPLTDTNPLNMTAVSNDPSSWPLINFYRIVSYFIVAASTAVVYDSALTVGLEFELVWMRHWSKMTVLYLSLRSTGILFCVMNILSSIPSISMTDTGCAILAFTQAWTSLVAYTMLGVITIARLHAMYQRSRKMLVFMVVVFMAVTIACGVVTAIGSNNASWSKLYPRMKDSSSSGSWDAYQMSASSPAPISALTRDTTVFCWPRLGYFTLPGRFFAGHSSFL